MARFNNRQQVSSIVRGPSIRAVPPGVHPCTGSAGTDSVCSYEDLEMYRGEARKKARANILGVLPEETHADHNNQYTNPLAPTMGAPVREASGMSPKNMSSNPLSRAFGNISKWPRGTFDDTRSGHASRNGQSEDMSVADGSPQARSKDHASYKPSVPSKLRSESTSKGAGSDRGSKSEHRGILGGSSSSASPPLDTATEDLTLQLERMPLLDDEPPVPKLVDPPWPLPKSQKGSVRQIAARFEGADRDLSTPAGVRNSLSDDQPRTSISGPRDSVSCPVRGECGSGQAWPYGSHEEADDPFLSETGRAPQASKSLGLKKDKADERAWERLTAALGHMPPGDLALLQEFLVG